MTEQPTGNHTLRALAVDDDSFMLDLFTSILDQLDIRDTASCSNAIDALTLIDQDHKGFDLVLCDLNMPHMDGLEFLRHLAQRNFDGALVLISGEDKRILDTAGKLAKAHDLNILGTVEKPVSSDQLGGLIRQIHSNAPRRQQGSLPGVDADDISQAFARDEFVVHYQPKIAVADQKVTGVEALVRWQHPERGLIPPGLFIPQVEAQGRIHDLTEVVLGKALSQSAHWRAMGTRLDLAVNISVDSLNHLDFPEFIQQQTDRHGINPATLTLEVTESKLMANMAAALEILARLSMKKVKLSVDDFGTGYSSLEQLQRAPFSEMKIDRAFVNGACRNDASRAILESSVELARKLDMAVVVEGVEDIDDWRLIKQLGCPTAQGFFMARPMPADAFNDWLNGWRGIEGL